MPAFSCGLRIVVFGFRGSSTSTLTACAPNQTTSVPEIDCACDECTPIRILATDEYGSLGLAPVPNPRPCECSPPSPISGRKRAKSFSRKSNGLARWPPRQRPQQMYRQLRNTTLVEAGASEAKARAAARVIADYETGISDIRSDLTLLKSMAGFEMGLSVAILFRVFSR